MELVLETQAHKMVEISLKEDSSSGEYARRVL